MICKINTESTNIARLKAGRTNPSLFVLKRLSEGLEVKVEEFLKVFNLQKFIINLSANKVTNQCN